MTKNRNAKTLKIKYQQREVKRKRSIAKKAILHKKLFSATLTTLQNIFIRKCFHLFSVNSEQNCLDKSVFNNANRLNHFFTINKKGTHGKGTRGNEPFSTFITDHL